MALSKRQQEIVDVSMRLIATKGIQNLTMKNLAREIGISEPAIYRHYKNKQEILLQLVSQFEAVSLAALAAIDKENLEPLEKIEMFIMNRYAACEANTDLAKVMFSEEYFLGDPELAQRMLTMMYNHRDVIVIIIKDAQENGQVRSEIAVDCLFRLIFGPVRLLVKQWCLSEFAFPLVKEGKRLWEAEKLLIEAVNPMTRNER